MGFQHSWANSQTEAEHYNGVQEILSQPQYENNVVSTSIDRLTIAVSHLALACDRPDHAMQIMLEQLGSKRSLGGLVETVSQILRDELVSRGRLTAESFNEVSDDLHHGQFEQHVQSPIDEVHIGIVHGRSQRPLPLHDPARQRMQSTEWIVLCAGF